MKVYVIETGDYSDRSVRAVASSFRAGCDMIKRESEIPDVVWGEDPEDLILYADYKKNVGRVRQKWESEHDFYYCFTEWDVVEESPAPPTASPNPSTHTPQTPPGADRPSRE